ncbi:hypothetical protein G6F40_007365 [Rhizopus arrhizus]|nr:hypothetical protein G6F23_011549 [Rhizopus arrhizus]KAG1111356.1 hypothetical protein G6F40_007365 [Rhizopus arrhizus]
MDPLVIPTITNVVRPKKSRVTLEDKDQKTKERILRNRAAAQESRDKKRRYVSDLESSNKRLEEENGQMKKKMKHLEEENMSLACQLESISKQFAALQAQIKFNTNSTFLFNDFCAEVIKPESKNQSQLLVPSPILSPSLSTDEDSSVYSPNSHDLLDDLLDWNGQQHTL